jgi:hypothetical protein
MKSRKKLLGVLDLTASGANEHSPVLSQLRIGCEQMPNDSHNCSRSLVMNGKVGFRESDIPSNQPGKLPLLDLYP